jgi:hypothetical protein
MSCTSLNSIPSPCISPLHRSCTDPVVYSICQSYPQLPCLLSASLLPSGRGQSHWQLVSLQRVLSIFPNNLHGQINSFSHPNSSNTSPDLNRRQRTNNFLRNSSILNHHLRNLRNQTPLHAAAGRRPYARRRKQFSLRKGICTRRRRRAACG